VAVSFLGTDLGTLFKRINNVGTSSLLDQHCVVNTLSVPRTPLLRLELFLLFRFFNLLIRFLFLWGFCRCLLFGFLAVFTFAHNLLLVVEIMMRIGQLIHFRLVIIQNYIEVIFSGEQRFQREQMFAFTHS